MKNRPFPKQTNSLQTWALYYLSLGWCVLPVKIGAKEPSVKWLPYQEKLPTEKQVKAWWTQFPKANIAILAGKVSGLYVLDIDSDQGKQEIEALSGDEVIPWTPTVKTARGEHIYFTSKEIHKYHKGQGWELIGEKHYVIAPPSVHKTGKIYKWGKLQTPEYKLAPIPTWLKDAINNKKRPDKDLEVDQEIQSVLKPYWEKEGQRHLLSLGLAGYLFNLAWPKSMVRHLFEAVCSLVNDEELEERLDTLNDTYNKGERGERLTGYETLGGIFTKLDLDRLEVLVKERQIPPKMRQIDNIRKSKGVKQFLINRQITDKIKEYLRTGGRLLKVENIRCYWFNKKDKQVLSIYSPEMKTYFDLEYGINPNDPLAKTVQDGLRSEIIRRGEQVKVFQFAHYNPDKHLLYIHAGNGLVYRLDGKSIKPLNNGVDGVYFEEISKEACFEADLDNPMSPYEALVEDLSFDKGTGVALNPKDQRLLFWVWIRTLLFEEIQPTKAMMVLTGDRSSGKSFAIRRLLWLLFGEDRDVTGLKDQDAWTPVITRNYLICLDNIDRPVRWLPGELDTAATGERKSVRVLYETNVEETYKVRCFISITSLDPPFKSGTTADRMLILRMKPRKEKIPESLLKPKIVKHRDQLWAGLLDQLNRDVEAEKLPYFDPKFRMADFALLAGKMLQKETGDLKSFRRIIEGLKEEQKAQVLSKSVIPSYIEIDEFDSEHGYTVTELYHKWKELSQDKKLGFAFKDERSLGRELTNVRIDLRNQYGMTWVIGGGRKPSYYFPESQKTEKTGDEPTEKEREHKKMLKQMFDKQERLS